jgi:cytochrome c6
MQINNEWRSTMKSTSTKLFSAAAILTASLLAPSVMRAQDGATTYKGKCAACHGPDGKGQTSTGKAMNAGDFASPDVQKMSDADLSAIITNGKDKMPSYGKSLKADQIQSLVAFIRTFKK